MPLYQCCVEAFVRATNGEDFVDCPPGSPCKVKQTFNLAEAARMLGFADATVRKYIESGMLPAAKSREGGITNFKWIIKRADLSAFMDEHGMPNPLALQNPAISGDTPSHGEA
jgi:hypothetical protein